MVSALVFWLVGARHLVTVSDASAFQARYGGRCPLANVCIVDGAVPGDPLVLSVESDALIDPPRVMSDYTVSTTECGALWEMNELLAESVWAKVQGQSAPIMSVMDSGFRTLHADLAGRIVGQRDYGEDDDIANVVSGGISHHGTFILGLLAAKADNQTGRAGLAPQGRIFAQKIADDSGALYFSYAIEAMAAIVDGTVPARIVSYSLSSKNPPQAFQQAVASLDRAGVILVAAASNCGPANCYDANNDDYPLYPASDEGLHVLTVASAGPGGAFNPWSHYGPESVHLAAPGVDICSFTTQSDTSVTTASGTSYAAPFVTAAAALVWEAHPELSHREVVRLVKASSKPNKAWAGKVLSGGVLDVEALIATPLVRATQKDEATLDVKNVAAAGKVNVIFFHEGTVQLARPNGVTARPFAKNEVLGLQGLSRAPSAGTLWTLDMPEHTDRSFSVTRTDAGQAEAMISVRTLVQAQALGLGSPRTGEAGVTSDASGAAAFTLRLPGTKAQPEPQKPDPLDTPAPEPEPDPTPQQKPQAKQSPAPLEPDPASKGCNAAGAPWAWLVGAWLFLRRR